LRAFTHHEEPEWDRGWETRKGDRTNGRNSRRPSPFFAAFIAACFDALAPTSLLILIVVVVVFAAMGPAARVTPHAKRFLEKLVQRVARALQSKP